MTIPHADPVEAPTAALVGTMMPTSQLVLGFDYDALDAPTRAVVLEKRDHINFLIRRTAEGIIEIGHDLIAVKKALGHGRFGPWLTAEFGWSADSAERFMRVGRAFAQIPQAAEFESTALYALSSGDVSDEIRQEFLDRAAAGEVITHRAVRDCLGPHVAYNSGETEWYTPPDYIAAVRQVLGEIDLDPASCARANRTVQAARYYTKAEDGLRQPWYGRVFLNPPYAKPLIQQFTDRLVQAYRTGEITAAIVLVNNATDTKWFQGLNRCATAICFPEGRIQFLDKHGNASGEPLQGQAVLFFGPSAQYPCFAEAFGRFGRPWWGA